MKPHPKACLAYTSIITTLGAVIAALSVYRLFQNGVNYQWLIFAYLTVLTGAFTVRIPRVNSKFSVSDTLIFLNTILFGPAAGILTGAIDGLHGSLRNPNALQRKQALLFNPAVLALSVFAAGEVFFKVLGHGPLSQEPAPPVLKLGLPVILAALAYYLCNSLLVAVMLALKSGQNPFRLWSHGLFATLGITLSGSAAGAVIAFSVRTITPMTLLVIVPILVTIYFVNTIYLRPEAAGSAGEDGARVAVTQRPAYRRFHYFMVALGLGFVALLVQNALKEKISLEWTAVASLAVCAGFVTVRIPGVKIKLSLADVFVFANTILFGPMAGGITAALDGLAGSLRCKSKARRWEFTLFNIAGMAVSAFLAGELFFRLLGHGPAYRGATMTMAEMFLPAVVLAISYYILNSMTVAVIVGLQMERNVFQVWRDNLQWGLVTYVACALGAVFVAAGILAMRPMIAIAVMLILAVIYISFRASAARVPQKAPSA